MIAEAEIRRLAGKLSVDPMVVNRDYVLGCFLHYLGTQDAVQESWVFKGGTALAKCYFANFRFSEDLDFTLTRASTADELASIADTAKAAMQDAIGIRTDELATHVEVMNDDYGKESFELKIYYGGPWPMGGSTPSLRIHTNRDEIIAFPTLRKPITHDYSDCDLLPKSTMSVYSLEEVFAEKLRAFSAQRRHAIARDVFDIYFLSSHKVDVQKAIGRFPDKCRIKGIEPGSIDFERILGRKGEYETNWERNLQYLLPRGPRVQFEPAWNTASALLQKVRAAITETRSVR